MDTAAGRVGRGRDVLVGATAADDDIRGPVVGGAEGEEDGGTGVWVGAIVAGEVRVGFHGGVGSHGKGLGGFGDEDEEGAVGEEVDEGVHVVGLVLGEDIHGNVDAAGDALVGEYLVGRIVVGGDRGIETVQAAGCYEDGSVGHCLR